MELFLIGCQKVIFEIKLGMRKYEKVILLL